MNSLERAHRTFMGPAATLDIETMLALACIDELGQPLSSARRYKIHFEKNELRSADGFWSLATYDDNRNLTDRAAGPRAKGSRDQLTYNQDGSLDICVQRESPGPSATRNWLATPPDLFSLILRVVETSTLSPEGAPTALAVRRVTTDLAITNLAIATTAEDVMSLDFYGRPTYCHRRA